MRCERVQRELSDAMHASAPAPSEVRAHTDGCRRCSRYAGELHRLHQLARLEPAPPVPDLAPAIMDRVRRERIASEPPVPIDRARSRRAAAPGRRLIAAGVAAGLVVGYVLGAGGPIPDRGGGSTALASEIPSRLVRAAVSLRGYQATFAITERNWSPRVPRRTFVARLRYRAPEGFQVQVHDTTRYPSAAWPRNDLRLVTDGRSWRATGPNPCPANQLPACHPDAVDRRVVGRPPFDPQTPLPTDVIVPMTVLAALDRVHVVGPDTVGDRDAEVVALRFRDATPLFSCLQFLGSWRPFAPQDRVLVWLDRSTWFPLRYEVFPAPGAERQLWASQFGIRGDRVGQPMFTAVARRVSATLSPPSAFRVAPGPSSIDEGFRDEPLGSWPDALSLPSSSGLHLVRVGRFTGSDARPFDERVAAYASGLAWATVARVTGASEHRLFGVGEFAEQVDLPGGGVGYYEPADATDARRVALHTARGEVLVTSNLPRARLLEMAGSLAVRSESAPRSWLTRRWSGGVVRDGLSVRAAVAKASFPVLTPLYVPAGYRAAAAQLVSTPTVRSVVLVYRRPAAELDGVGLRLYEALGATMPPPQSVSEQAVEVRGVVGRWSPESHLLEWVEDGAYRSITSPALELTTLLRVATSLRMEG